MKLNLFSKLYTGLDIGSHSVKVVQIERTKKGSRLVGCGLSAYESETPDDDQMVRAIQKVHQDNNLPLNREVWLGISGRSTSVRVVNLPKMPEDEIKTTIDWHLEEYLPFPRDEMYYDWEILNPPQEEAGMKKEILIAVVGSKKELVDRLVSIANQARIDPVGINLVPMALYNSLRRKVGRDPLALIDIGAKITTVIIVAKRILCFSRQVEIGGESITRAMADESGLGYQQAEDMKREDSRLINLVEDNQLRLLKACQPVIMEILTEIRKSISFFESEYSEYLYGKVNRIVLSGGTSRILHIDKLLTESLGIPAEVFNPLDSLEVSPSLNNDDLKKTAPLFATGIGLIEGIWEEEKKK